MALRYDTISFLSDYGHDDEFVGVVKSVIRAIAPDVAVIDVTHEVPAPRHPGRRPGPGPQRPVPVPGRGAGRGRSRRGRPTPGGGRRGRRRRVGAGRAGQRAAGAGGGAGRRGRPGGRADRRRPTSSRPPGPTFAGRDVFAPAAAHLCAGRRPDRARRPRSTRPACCPSVLPISHLDDARARWWPRCSGSTASATPSSTSIPAEVEPLRRSDAAAPRRRPCAPLDAWRTYGEIGPGEIGLVVDSYGVLSIAVDQRSAAEPARVWRPAPRCCIDGLRRRQQEGVDRASVTRVQSSAAARDRGERRGPMRQGTTIALAVLLARHPRRGLPAAGRLRR